MEKKNKFLYIDVLRGLAILAVILVHVGLKINTSILPKIAADLISAGKYGVQLFFIASAFTIFYSYNGRAGMETQVDRNFFIRRFFRIAPMYYLAIFYYLWQIGTGPTYFSGGKPLGLKAIIMNLTFTNALDPESINSVVPGGWSIGVEMMFYLLVPFLFSAIKTMGGAINFFTLSLVIKKICEYMLFKYTHVEAPGLLSEFAYMYLPSQLPVFALGIIFYFLLQREKQISAGSLLAIFAFLLMEILTGKVSISEHIWVAACFIILALGLSYAKLSSIFWRMIAGVGKLSYSLYIVHFASIYVIDRLGLIKLATSKAQAAEQVVLVFIAVLLLSAVIAWLTHRYIEVGFQKVGNDLIKRLDGKGKEAAA